ncbi:hypothetical protein WMY93_002235 [Mugilogobius chulae]|uniref:Protein kinase domain-containing protein n=1 Tax=Mugilogobius chulae TaxID=88201 RepID=A0AAW0Q473_9GOBI
MDDEPNEVLRAIRDLKTTMNDRFNILEESLSSTKASVADLSARTHEVEKASSDHENRLSLVETTLAAIRSENNLLRQKVVDLEARSRRQILKLWPVMVDRAHRLGVRAPEAGGRPRVTIARIHSCQTKEKILQLARQGFPLRHNDKPVYIFPDYPAEITKQRQAFVDVRKRLEAGGARYSADYAPEHFNNIMFSPGPVTVWQLGLVLYNMLFYNRPLATSRFIGAIEDFSIPPVIPPDCREVLQSCLERDPLKRPTLEQLRAFHGSTLLPRLRSSSPALPRPFCVEFACFSPCLGDFPPCALVSPPTNNVQVREHLVVGV